MILLRNTTPPYYGIATATLKGHSLRAVSGNFSNIWTKWLIQGRWVLLILWFLLFSGSVWLLPKLDFRFNIGQMLRGDDETIQEVRSFYKAFPPSDGHLVITASSKDVLTVEQLRQAAKWAEQYQALPEVASIITVSQLLDLKMDGFTLDEWARLGGDGQESIALGDGAGMATFKGSLVSHDLKSVAIYLIKAKGVRDRELFRAAEAVQTTPWEGAVVRQVGMGYLISKMGLLLKSNFSSLVKIQLVALALVIPLFMRSLRRAYLPMLISISALAFYIALFILMDKEFGVMNLAGPGLILIIGLADAIHLQQKFDDARALGKSIHVSLTETFQSVGRACFLTSLTTACGFLSLVLARHEEVYDFGIWCAIGVGVSYLTVMLFMPMALCFFPGKAQPAGTHNKSAKRFVKTEVLRKFATPATVLLIFLTAGIHRTRIDSSLERELPSSSPAVRENDWFTENFRGIDRIEVDLRADLRAREVFSLIEEMQKELGDFPGIAGSRSYVDAIRMTLAPDVIETEDGPMLGIQALGSGGNLPRNLMSRNYDRACIVFYRNRHFGTDAYETFRNHIASYERRLPDGSSMRLNGQFPMFYESTTLISKTLLISLGCSLAMITIILIVVLRSLRLALLCLVPNAIPLLVVAGLSGWLGESLHLGILVVFSIGLGLAVDDTIHLMVRFKQLEKSRHDHTFQEVMDEALTSSGFAIILTSLVLLVVSACFLASSFTTMRWVGITLGVVSITALLADLIILPWLVEKFGRSPLSNSRTS